MTPTPALIVSPQCQRELVIAGVNLEGCSSVVVSGTGGTAPAVEDIIVDSSIEVRAYTGLLNANLVGHTLLAVVTVDGQSSGAPIPIATVKTAPVVTNTNREVAIGATLLFVDGSNFVSPCTVVLRAAAGTVTQPTALVILSPTLVRLQVAELNADLLDQELTAEAVCDEVPQCSDPIAIGTVRVDTFPPIFLTGFPVAGTSSDQSVKVQVQTDEPGTAYVAVLADGAAAPSAAQVKLGQDSTGSAALASGSAAVAAALTTTAVTSTATLVADTAYDVWIVVEDDEAPTNLQAGATKVDATTGPDVTPPVFAPTFPSTTSTDTQVTVSCAIHEPGTCYWVVVPDGAAAPSASQVMAGTNAAGETPVASGSISLATPNAGGADVASPLPPVTAYDVYFVAADAMATPNAQVSATKVDVATLADQTPPDWISGYPLVPYVTDSTLAMHAQLSEAGTVYFVVLADNAPAPSSPHVMGGTDGNGDPSFFATAVSVPFGSTASVTAIGLGASTAYDVWCLAADDWSPPNVQVGPVKVNTATSVDVTAPGFTGGTPVAASITDVGFDISVQLNEPGTYFYVIVANNAAQPTPAQVKAGTDAAGATPVTAGTTIVSTALTTTLAAVSGLTHDTEYDAWVVAQDDEATPNLAPSTSKVDVLTTADVSPPTWTSGYPRLTAVTDETLSVEVQMNEGGHFFVVIVANDAPAPTATQVRPVCGRRL